MDKKSKEKKAMALRLAAVRFGIAHHQIAGKLDTLRGGRTVPASYISGVLTGAAVSELRLDEIKDAFLECLGADAVDMAVDFLKQVEEII